MSAKIADQIRESCNKAKSFGVRIVRGPWFERDAEDKVVAACATGAVIWAAGQSSEVHKIKACCLILEVDPMWLRRFWMGWDRGYQAVMFDKDGKELGKDEVSALGIVLAEELCD